MSMLSIINWSSNINNNGYYNKNKSLRFSVFIAAFQSNNSNINTIQDIYT